MTTQLEKKVCWRRVREAGLRWFGQLCTDGYIG